MVAVADGRRLRREQNREAVLEALGELFAEGVLEPSTDEIAERAGVSSRSLFRYFDDVDDLNRAAIEHQLAAARPLFDVDLDPDQPTSEKVDGLVAARSRLFEACAPAARAARVCAHRNQIVADQLRQSRAFLRGQVRSLFARELAARPAVVAAVDALTSFEAYELLRHDQGLSRPKAMAAIAAALTELVGE